MTDNRLSLGNMPFGQWLSPVVARAAASLIAGAGDLAGMTLAEIERLAAMAERACVVVTDRPDDAALRESLFDLLAPLVNPAFLDGPERRPMHVQGLLRQTGVLAEILRSHIDESRTGRRSDRFDAMHIGNGARELRRLLAALIAAIAAIRNE
jgi:hypothetical protein